MSGIDCYPVTALRLRHDALGAGAVYERFVESGDGRVDFSGIIRCLRGP